MGIAPAPAQVIGDPRRLDALGGLLDLLRELDIEAMKLCCFLLTLGIIILSAE